MYIFALDRLHYYRNLPAFLLDLCSLKTRYPSLYEQSKSYENIMGRKTNHRFSSILIDQFTEQTVC